MSVIGNWGSAIQFEVSADKELTFKSMNRSVSGRWKDHEIIGQKPLSEFAGASLSDVSLSCVFNAMRGVNPREMIEKLEAAVESGQVEHLYIGGKKIGTGKMKLASMSEAWDVVDEKGVLIKATVSLSFSEYIEQGNLTAYDPTTATIVPWEFIVGDAVTFVGTVYYTKATKKGKPKKAKQGPAKITKYQKKKLHPWYIKTTDKKKTKVKGWVNDGDFI